VEPYLQRHPYTLPYLHALHTLKCLPMADHALLIHKCSNNVYDYTIIINNYVNMPYRIHKCTNTLYDYAIIDY